MEAIGERGLDPRSSVKFRQNTIGALENQLDGIVAWRPGKHEDNLKLKVYEYLQDNPQLVEALRSLIANYRKFYGLNPRWKRDLRPLPKASVSPSRPVRPLKSAPPVKPRPVGEWSDHELFEGMRKALLEGGADLSATMMLNATQHAVLLHGAGAENKRMEEQAQRRLEMKDVLPKLVDPNLDQEQFIRAVLRLNQDMGRVVRLVEVEEWELFSRWATHLEENRAVFVRNRSQAFACAVEMFIRLVKEVEAEKAAALAVPASAPGALGVSLRVIDFFKKLFS